MYQAGSVEAVEAVAWIVVNLPGNLFLGPWPLLVLAKQEPEDYGVLLGLLFCGGGNTLIVHGKATFPCHGLGGSRRCSWGHLVDLEGAR
jgi:hypothetical protein